MVLINGVAESRIPVSDRGLQYGDGVFETIAYRNGKLELLELHIERLVLACQRLAIPFQHTEELRAELVTVLNDIKDQNAVIKIIISRGNGGRGYFADNTIVPTRIITIHAMPSYPDNYQQNGVVVRFCQQRLSENPSLAGIKHLNRLEQVLARNEWSDPKIAEGIMSDQHGNIIEGTMSNLFLVKENTLITAQLEQSGIAGIIREQILQIATALAIPSKLTNITKDMLMNADEAFICNSIIGIWPIIKLSEKSLTIGKITRQLQTHLNQIIKEQCSPIL